MQRFASYVSCFGLGLVLLCSCSDDTTPKDTGSDATTDGFAPDQQGPTPDAGVPDGAPPDSGALDSQAPDASLPTGWATALGGAEAEVVGTSASTAVDSSGNTYLVASFGATASFGAKSLTAKGQLDAVAVKLDPKGQVLWASPIGGTENDMGWGVAVDGSGNVFAVGIFAGSMTVGSTTLTSNGSDDIFLVKLDPAGAVLWATSFGGTDLEEGNSVRLDSAGNIVIGGYYLDKITFGSTTLTSKGSIDTFVAKLDPSGVPLWAVSGGGTGDDAINHLAIDASDNILATGTFGDTATFGGTSVSTTAGGEYFLASYKPDGTLNWVKASETTDFSVAYAVAVDSQGDVITGGFLVGTMKLGSAAPTSNGQKPDFFVAKHGSDGSVKWVIAAGGAESDQVWGVAVDASDDVHVTGFFGGWFAYGGQFNSAGDSDAFTLKLNGKTGTFLDWFTAGGTGPDSGGGIAVHGTTPVVTGMLGGSAKFCYDTLPCSGKSDLFVWKPAL